MHRARPKGTGRAAVERNRRSIFPTLVSPFFVGFFASQVGPFLSLSLSLSLSLPFFPFLSDRLLRTKPLQSIDFDASISLRIIRNYTRRPQDSLKRTSYTSSSYRSTN